MRWLLRIIGGLSLLIAIAMGIIDANSWVMSGDFIFTDIGSMWYSTHPTSLQVIEPVVSRYIHPALWNPFITNVLLCPVTPAFGLLGLILVLFSRHKTRTTKKDLFIR